VASTLGEAVLYLLTDNSKLESGLGDAEKQTESASGNMAKALGGALVAGAAVAGSAIVAIGGKAFDVASRIDAATDQIGASLGLSADKAKAYGKTIKDVYANNFGDSIEDVGKSIETVAKQLKLTAADPALKTMTENAFRLRDVFGVDVADSVDAVKTLMDNFGVSGEEAFDLIAKGYQNGMDRSGDFLDSIGEYSTQFANGGTNANRFFAIMEAGMQGGVLGTDKAADAFKEFRVRIQDGSDLTKDSLTAIGINADEMAAKFADGSITANDAFTQVIAGLAAIDDKNVQMQAGVGLLGTQFEDLGQSGALALTTLTGHFDEIEGATASLDSKYTNLGSVVEGFWRQFEVGIAPAGEALLQFANDNLPAFQGAVNTASGIVVTVIGYIPLAVADMRIKWDEDWGKMRTTLTSFTSEIPGQLQIFWTEVQNIFNVGGNNVKVDWELLWGYNVIRALTDAITLALAEMTEFTRAINGLFKAFYALFHADWAGFWAGLEQTANAATDDMLNAIEYVFGVEFRNSIVSGLTYAWDGMKEMWTAISGWFASTFGTLSSWVMPNITLPAGGGGGGGGFGGSSGFNNMPSLTPGDWPISASAAAGVTNHINVNMAGGGYDQGFAAGEGIVDAMRFRGH